MIKKSLLIVVVCMNINMTHAMRPIRVYSREAISSSLEKEYEYALDDIGWAPGTERILVDAESEDDIIKIIDDDIAKSKAAKDYVDNLFYDNVDESKREEVLQAVLKIFCKHNKQQAKL